MRRDLKNRILLWFGLLERMEESSQPSKCLKFEVCGILATTWPRKTWSELIKTDLEQYATNKKCLRLEIIGGHS